MGKNILYIGGGFDILHNDHKTFIINGIKKFSNIYGKLEKIIIGLKSDTRLSNQKGEYRPIFSFIWRKNDMSDFLKQLNINYEIIDSGDFFNIYNKNFVVQIRSNYQKGIVEMQKNNIETILIDEVDVLHTSSFVDKLLELQSLSNCNLRKVSALLIRNGEIISGGYSGKGNCDVCQKYIAYKKGGGKLSKHIDCDYPHAEIVVLKNAQKLDDLLITDSPCMNCARLIFEKGIRRVVFLKDYYDTFPINFLIQNGVEVRRSGINL